MSVILAEPDVEGIGLMFDTEQFDTYQTLRAGSKDLEVALRRLLESVEGTVTPLRLKEEMENIRNGNPYVQEVTRELFAPYAYQYGEKSLWLLMYCLAQP